MNLAPPLIRRAPRLILFLCLLSPALADARDLVRPEPVGSMRIIWREKPAYQELDRLWEAWWRAYPSEEAYGNWMYAARYAENPRYGPLLEKGLKKYPGSPVLLYLKAMTLMVRHDPAQRSAVLDYLNRAVALDPAYDDPWYSLVIEQMALDHPAEVRRALGKLLELGAVDDATLDYCSNMLTCLEPGAILVTNGDMDTYPCWMLQLVEGVRPDVVVLNQSLLNTDWYPARYGLPLGPGDWDAKELAALRARELPCSDTLIERLVRQANREKRAVHFAATLMVGPRLEPLRKAGQASGLTVRVAPAAGDAAADARLLAACWLDNFRHAGLDSWTFRNGDPRRGSRRLAGNYASGLAELLGRLPARDTATARALFEWYRAHLAPCLGPELNKSLAPLWQENWRLPEAERWLKEQKLQP